MSTFDGNNSYFSGQGVVLIGDRDANGKPKGLVPVGNVSALILGLAATVLEHHESQTGNRAIDLRLVTQLQSTISITIENFNAYNLSNALTGDVTYNLTQTIASESVGGYLGKVMGLANMEVSAFTLKRGATSLVAYTNDTTPFDYMLNAAAGSFKLNDGSIVGTASLTTGGTVPSAVLVGTTTTVTVANTAVAGSYAVFDGFAGADAALLNGKAFRVVTATATNVTLAVDTTGKTITIGTPLSYFDGTALTAGYTSAPYNRIDAMTNLSTEKYLRFEGLNTADGGNPVVVEVFRFIVDPLKQLALIADAIGPFQLDGNVLSDSLQLSGSKFFKVSMLR